MTNTRARSSEPGDEAADGSVGSASAPVPGERFGAGVPTRDGGAAATALAPEEGRLDGLAVAFADRTMV
jgi:hypothetical protein